MFKTYKADSQKWKTIRSMIRRWAYNFYEDFDLEQTWDIFIWNNVWARLSQLKKAWVVTAQYYENPHLKWWKRAKYKLTDIAIAFYKDLYKEESLREIFNEEEKDLNFFERLWLLFNK